MTPTNTKLQIGDTVRVDAPTRAHHNTEGTIVDTDPFAAQVKLPNQARPIWFHNTELELVARSLSGREARS